MCWGAIGADESGWRAASFGLNRLGCRAIGAGASTSAAAGMDAGGMSSRAARIGGGLAGAEAVAPPRLAVSRRDRIWSRAPGLASTRRRISISASTTRGSAASFRPASSRLSTTSDSRGFSANRRAIAVQVTIGLPDCS